MMTLMVLLVQPTLSEFVSVFKNNHAIIAHEAVVKHVLHVSAVCGFQLQFLNIWRQ